MTKENINIIDIIKRNSKLTHSDLSLDEKEFAKHKNVLELLEKASEVSSELRAKLEKLDLDTLHYSYKIMCVHTCNDDVPMEYLFKYFAETEAKYNSSPLELFLINNGCGTPYKTTDWQYSKKFTGYKAKESEYLNYSNPKSLAVFESHLPEQDRPVFLRAFMKKYPYGLPSERPTRYATKYFTVLTHDVPQLPLPEPQYNPAESLLEQVMWVNFLGGTKTDALVWFGSQNDAFYELEKIVVYGMRPETTQVERLYHIMKNQESKEARRMIARLTREDGLYKVFEKYYMQMFHIGKGDEYIKDMLDKLPSPTEMTPEMLHCHFVDFAYPGDDYSYLPIFGCNKREFATKFPMSHVLTHELLNKLFDAKIKSYATKQTKEVADDIAHFFKSSLPRLVYPRRKLTEKGAGLIYAVIRKYGVASRDDKWAINLIKEIEDTDNLDHIYSW